jgi:hypothetical protein
VSALRKLPWLALAVLSAVVLAACGDDDGDGASGAASAIPPEPVLYLEADISGEGTQHENLDALLTELGELPLLGSPVDPRTLVEQAFQDLGEENGVDISYAEDFEPWLGDELALGFSSLSDAEPGFVLSVAVTDEEIARDSIERISAEDAAEETDEEYDGVSYQVSGTGDYAVGVFDDKFVLATVDEFEAAVDASRGDSLASDDEVSEALDSVGDERLGAMYVDVGGAADLAVEEGDAEEAEVEAARDAVPQLFDEPLVAALTAGDQTLAMDLAFGHPEDFPEVQGTDRLGEAPGDAFAAFGIAALGDQIDAGLDQIESLVASVEGAEGFDRETIDALFEDQVGVPLDEVLAGLDDAVAFGRGDLAAKKFVAALDIEPTGDTGPLSEFLDGLERVAGSDGDTIVGPPLKGGDAGFSAQPTPRAAAGSAVRFVNAELGEALSFALASDRATAEQSGSGALGDTPLFQAAADALGGEHEMLAFVDVGQILDATLGGAGLLDVATGGASQEEAIASFLAEKLGFASIGISYEDERVIERIVLGLDR